MGRRRSYQAEILLVSASALMLEISTTRLISFELFYCYFGVALVAGMLFYVAAAGLLWSLRAEVRP